MDPYQANPQNNESNESGFQMGDYWQVIRNRYEVILLSLLLVFATAAVITSLMKEKYQSTVVVQLHNITNTRGNLSDDITPGQLLYASPNFIANQFERISSDLVLLRVVQEVDLVNRWRLSDEKQAVNRLRGAVDTQSRRGTDVVEIRVTDEDPDLAAIIAQNVYQSYESSLDNDVNRVNAEAGSHLDEQLTQQMQKVTDARIAMHKAMKDLKVIDLAKSSGYRSDEVTTPEDGIIVTGEVRVDDMRFEISGLKSQLEGLAGLEGTDMIRKAAMLGIEDQTIQRYYPMFNDLLLEEQVWDRTTRQCEPFKHNLRVCGAF
jgi:polysaccharide biosynthesis transport protein